jgi:hypothetical protein
MPSYFDWDHSCALLKLVFGGKVEHLRPFLLEEKIVDGWEPWNKKRYGVTCVALHVAVVKLALHAKTMPPTRAMSRLSPGDVP